LTQAKLATNALAVEYAALTHKQRPPLTPQESQRLTEITQPLSSSKHGSKGTRKGGHKGYKGLNARGPSTVVLQATMLFADDTQSPEGFDQVIRQ